MRSEPNLRIEKCRAGGPRETNCGVFDFVRKGQSLKVIASDGGGWDHVSVSRPDRTPTYDEMTFIKDQFFKDEEAVMQLHPPKSTYVNNHPYCLHLWRPQTQDEIDRVIKAAKEVGMKWPSDWPKESPGSIPLPPPIFVGVVGAEPNRVKEALREALSNQKELEGTVLINGVEYPTSEMKVVVDKMLEDSMKPVHDVREAGVVYPGFESSATPDFEIRADLTDITVNEKAMAEFSKQLKEVEECSLIPDSEIQVFHGVVNKGVLMDTSEVSFEAPVMKGKSQELINLGGYEEGTE